MCQDSDKAILDFNPMNWSYPFIGPSFPAICGISQPKQPDSLG